MKNQKKTDKRKNLLILPLLILPFLALGFYALGGGQAGSKTARQIKGINTSLPDAAVKTDGPKDKMDIYRLQQRDSVQMGENKLDQIASRLGFSERVLEDPALKINEKLAELDRQISLPDQSRDSHAPRKGEIKLPGMQSDVDRLEKLMAGMQESSRENGEDEELRQLNGMLEKVLDIQHPERVREGYSKKETPLPDSLFAAIPAEITEKQTIVQGSALKLSLKDSITINGVNIPKGHPLFAVCNLTNQRLLLEIRTIRMGNLIIPVDLSVYGMDGIKGIAAPEAVVGNAMSSGADDAVRSLQFMTMDQSMGAQVAGAGIDAAKGLFSKKVRRAKMKVKAGFSVLLRNNQIKK